jgi:diguanylate cyclase (GGDEF)-like protein
VLASKAQLAALETRIYADPEAAQELVDGALAEGWLEAWRAQLLLATVHYRRNRFDASLQALAAAEPLLEEVTDVLAPARLQTLVAQNFYRMGSLDQAMLAARAAEHSLDESASSAADGNRLEHKALLAQLHNIMGAVHLASGDQVNARTDFERSLVLFQELGNAADIAKLHNNVGALLIEDGDLSGAEPHLRKSLALAQSLGRTTTVIPNLVNLSELHARRGEHAQARALADECFATVRSADDESSLVWCHEAASYQHQAAGELPEAIEHARLALAQAERFTLQQHVVEIARTLAEMLAQLGLYEEAGAMNDKAFVTMNAIRDQLLRLRLEQSSALIDYERARAEVQTLQLQAGYRERVQSLLLLGLALLIPLLLASLWLLRSRSRTLDALAVANRRNAELAMTDGLTALPNRRALLGRLNEIEARSPAVPYALALVDVDHFKAINDRLGHEQGDAALRRVADCLRAVLPPAAMAARWGGEEFVLLLPNADPTVLSSVCERLRAELAQSAPGQPVLTVSIGIAASGQQRPSEVIASADAAMYAAKRNGRNRIEVAA